jgi:hypothetical protein
MTSSITIKNSNAQCDDTQHNNYLNRVVAMIRIVYAECRNEACNVQNRYAGCQDSQSKPVREKVKHFLSLKLQQRTRRCFPEWEFLPPI